MEGLSRAAASPVPIQFRGETILLEPFTFRDIGTVEQYILNKRKNPIGVAKEIIGEIPNLPADVVEKLIERAYSDARKENHVTEDEYQQFARSQEGIRFIMWLMLDKRYPGKYPLAVISEIMAGMSKEEVEALRIAQERAAGVDELGNSTGLDQGAEAATPQHGQVGENSSGT